MIFLLRDCIIGIIYLFFGLFWVYSNLSMVRFVIIFLRFGYCRFREVMREYRFWKVCFFSCVFQRKLFSFFGVLFFICKMKIEFVVVFLVVVRIGLVGIGDVIRSFWNIRIFSVWSIGYYIVMLEVLVFVGVV